MTSTESERYSDRPLRPDDIAFVMAVHDLPHAAPFVQSPTAVQLLDTIDDTSRRARIVVDEGGSPVGFVAMSNHDGWLVEIHRLVAARPGAGRWALREALRWAFDEARVHRVWLEVTVANARARRLYEREGFTHEGTYRDGYRTASGAYEDLAHYGILRSEWTRER